MKRKNYDKHFQKCCGVRPSVIAWGIQRDKNGVPFDNSAGLCIRCKRCGAELVVCKEIEQDDELDVLALIAAKEWNVGHKTVVPFTVERNYFKAEEGDKGE